MRDRLVVALSLGILVLLGSNAWADATFVYELTDADGTRKTKRIAVSGFWARVEDPAVQGRFLLFQAGKFFPVYAVDEDNKTYALLTEPVSPRLGPGARTPAAKQEQASETTPTPPADTAPAPSTEATGKPAPQPAVQKSAPPRTALKPTGKKRTVADVSCRVIGELVAGEPVAEHCMANTAGFKVTRRELITLGRIFEMAKKLDMDWLGVATEDERFFSAQSRRLDSGKTLELKSVSIEPLPPGYHRIPRNFSLLERSASVRSN